MRIWNFNVPGSKNPSVASLKAVSPTSSQGSLGNKVTPSTCKRIVYDIFIQHDFCERHGKINTAIHFGIRINFDNAVLISSVCKLVRNL